MVAVLENRIFHKIKIHMKILGVLFITIFLWITYEIWRAPLLEETENGKYRTKRPTKKLSDLWRKRK
jgi:shikimate kinase